MTGDVASVPPWRDESELAGLSVCGVCFGLTGRFQGREHRCRCQATPDEWRKQEWSGYDIAALVELCGLCARGTMQSGSRWMWLVCDECRHVNRVVGEALGSDGPGVLPLGRHSMMNGVGFNAEGATDEDIDAFSHVLAGLTEVWMRLHEWGEAEVKRLHDLAGLGSDPIPVPTWMHLFPPSIGASVDAFCRFVEYDLPDRPLFEELRRERRSFLATDHDGT